MKTITCTLMAAIVIAATGCSGGSGGSEGSDGGSPVGSPIDETDADTAPPPLAPEQETDPAQGETVSTFDLSVGDCFGELAPDPNLETIETVPCSEPHSAQVVSTFDLPDGPWAGLEEVAARAQERCPADLASLPPTATDGLEVFYLHPTERSWQFGDREIICLATSTAPRPGSLPVG